VKLTEHSGYLRQHTQYFNSHWWYFWFEEEMTLCFFDFTLSSALTEISGFHLNTRIMENVIGLWKYCLEDCASI